MQLTRGLFGFTSDWMKKRREFFLIQLQLRSLVTQNQNIYELLLKLKSKPRFRLSRIGKNLFIIRGFKICCEDLSGRFLVILTFIRLLIF